MSEGFYSNGPHRDRDENPLGRGSLVRYDSDDDWVVLGWDATTIYISRGWKNCWVDPKKVVSLEEK